MNHIIPEFTERKEKNLPPLNIPLSYETICEIREELPLLIHKGKEWEKQLYNWRKDFKYIKNKKYFIITDYIFDKQLKEIFETILSYNIVQSQIRGENRIIASKSDMFCGMGMVNPNFQIGTYAQQALAEFIDVKEEDVVKFYNDAYTYLTNMCNRILMSLDNKHLIHFNVLDKLFFIKKDIYGNEVCINTKIIESDDTETINHLMQIRVNALKELNIDSENKIFRNPYLKNKYYNLLSKELLSYSTMRNQENNTFGIYNKMIRVYSIVPNSRDLPKYTNEKMLMNKHVINQLSKRNNPKLIEATIDLRTKNNTLLIKKIHELQEAINSVL